VSLARKKLPGTPVAGFFAAGEIGPVGGKNFIHGHTASFALFRESR
jgi:small ligand-binding sensory domain FIST